MVLEDVVVKRCYYLVYVFLIGLFIGIMIVNIGHDALLKQEGLLGCDMIVRIRDSSPNARNLLFYVMKQRLVPLSVIMVLSITVICIPVIYLYVGYLGMAAGCLISIAIARYGIRGLLLVIAATMPQMLVLLPGYLMVFCQSMEWNQIWKKSRVEYKKDYRNEYRDEGVESRKQYFRISCKILFTLAVVIIGCILESYVNPKWLAIILNLF